jgi:NADPH:quinone reductase-like Zn-dependent oxidoreductase
VIGRSGKAIFLTSYWKKGEKEKIDYNYVYSIQQLKNNGYTLVDETQTDDEVEKAIELLKEKGRLVDGKVLSN